MPSPASATSSAAGDWPGKRLGLPETGPRSIARPGRRFAGLCLDWALAVVISVAFFAYDPFATLTIFAAAQIVFLITASGSVGHLAFGMRVVPVAGGYLGPWRPIVRTLLLCLLIPAVIWDRDQRGMHDRLAGTVLVRR
ncbi:RDD family protein [Lysobacter korlensis]|uniref:RDD family protein n=1 Tax=Lysobacter korlensis TaxID=553636 RepID=A0ABV6RM96_9GAMM